MKKLLMVALALSTCACSGADWRANRFDPGYRTPGRITVAVLVEPSARGEDIEEASQALGEAIVNELRDRGVEATLSAARSGQAFVGATIAEWEPGNRALRWLWPGPGEGWIVVRVGAPGFAGEVRGYVRSGFFGGSSMASADAAGRAIGAAISEGLVDE